MVGIDGSKLDLSLRRSRTGEPADVVMETDTEGEGEEGMDDDGEAEEEKTGGVARTSCDPEVASLEDLEVGKVVRGFVKAVTDVGVFVRYGRLFDVVYCVGQFIRSILMYLLQAWTRH